MTLDDAIAHAHEVAEGCGACAEEHAQLAEWLEELRGLRGRCELEETESILGSQIKELRDKAKLLKAHADGLSAPFVIPSTKELMALTMLDSASRMEEAADTVESLRDRLQDSECDVVKSYGKHPVTNNEVVLYNCSKCGMWIGLSANYCGNCGARIRKAVKR